MNPQPTPDPTTTLPPDVLRALAAQSGWFDSWWLVAVLALVALALVALVVRAARRRLRRVWIYATVALVVLVVTAAAAANAYSGYVPDLWAARLLLVGQGTAPDSRTPARSGSPTEGTLRGVSVPVPAALAMPASTTWVYTPPGYDPTGARYPVVYLIHGEPSTSVSWFAAGQAARVLDTLIVAGTIRPMIVVAPDVNGRDRGDTECLNSTNGGSQVETYLHTVVAWVDQHLATVPDPGHRAIGGMSSGGYCALDQGLRHQDVYGTILAIEPYTDPGGGGRAMLSSRAEFAAHDVLAYLPTTSFPRTLNVFVAVPGEQVRSAEAVGAAKAVDLLRVAGQRVEYRVEPGAGHTWRMARAALPYALVFASTNMPAGRVGAQVTDLPLGAEDGKPAW
ncbi:MAG: alpha/beta hydrolase [Georgenia sp.]